MSKYTVAERALVKSIVATLSIKRIPEPEIINEIYNQTNKTIAKLHYTKLKRESKRNLSNGTRLCVKVSMNISTSSKKGLMKYSLQKKHHEIIDSLTEPTTVKQTSLAELHRLNITLSNYFDVAPDIINGSTLSTTQQTTKTTTETESLSSNSLRF